MKKIAICQVSKPYCIAMQNDSMQVTVFKVDQQTGIPSAHGIPLGAFGDIDELGVREQISQQVLMP